jgi:hypothetical protein
MEERNTNQLFARAFRLGMDKLLLFMAQALSFFRANREKTSSQFKELFHTTSDQVREKAEETRRAVKLRMAVLEIEHHLNRLYPQIGKLTCDLLDTGKRSVLQDADLKSRIEMAAEYRERLRDLKQEQKKKEA